MKPGPKPNKEKKREIYYTWKLLNEKETLDQIGERFHRSGARISQIVKEIEADLEKQNKVTVVA